MGLDVTSLLEPLTGVGAMVRELTDGLAARPDVDLHLFSVSWRGREAMPDVAARGATVHARPVPARLARAAWRRTDHPTARTLVGPLDVVHGPNFVVPPGGGAVEVVTIHDLTALRYPEMCTPDVLEWPHLARRALRRGAWVHTVSEAVALEVRAAFPEAGERVVAVPNGVRVPAPPDPSTDASAGWRLAGGDRYVLAVGTVEPRKDLPSLVEAFDQLAAHDGTLRLVIAGADGLAAAALDAGIAAAHHKARIVRLGRVHDAQRLALVRGAAVLAYPSLYEGFGLVPLEAMSVGTPVVATRVGAIPEVVGDAAVLVPAEDPAALAAALHQVLTDPDRRASLVELGAARLERFSWDATVAGLVELYRRALAG